MAGTTTKGFPYPQDADAVDVAGDIQSLAESVDDYFSATASSVAETYLPISASSSLSPIGYLTEATASATYLNKTEIPVTIGIAASDETTDLATGSAVATFRLPHAMTLTEVRASVTTAPVGSTIIVDINEGGASILSTKLSIDASEKTSTTAATPAVISDSSLADDSEITVDIDQIGSSTAGTGLKVWLIGTKA